MAAITKATSVSIKKAPSERKASEISHHRDQHDMNDGQQRKCVAEGLVHYVPEMEHFLGTGEKQHALRDRRFFARNLNRPLQVRMPRPQQAAQRKQLFAETKMPPSQRGDLEDAAYIQQHHVD